MLVIQSLCHTITLLNFFENVVITNHIAGLSEYNRNRSIEIIKENIKRFCRGENLLNIVNKREGY